VIITNCLLPMELGPRSPIALGLQRQRQLSFMPLIGCALIMKYIA
jgi:hypothetical protein